MPTISIFFGLIVRMYYNDHNPPHFHVLYQGMEAVFAIENGDILDGDLPNRAKRIIREWSSDHRGELLENWERARQKLPLKGIPGADVE